MRRASYRIATGRVYRRLSHTLLASDCACALLHTKPAFAYVDPNVGGSLFQMFAPLFVVIIAQILSQVAGRGRQVLPLRYTDDALRSFLTDPASR